MIYLSIETSISAVKVTVTTKKKREEEEEEVTEDIWVEKDIRFTPGYGGFERQVIEEVDLSAQGLDNDILNGTMHKNRFNISSSRGIIKAVKLKTRKDTSNGLTQTCSVSWRTKDDLVEIPSAIPINTPISPEEVKDVSALYNVNQLSKIMSMFKHVEWRHKTFFDALDTHVTNLLNVLNDPNMVITIFGRPDLIRKITPTEYSYQSPQNIGPVELEFNKTVVTSDRRIYQFMSSQKLKDSNELTIILCPKNSDRIVYRIYDYQMYVSNEIRNSSYNTLPAIHAFERWTFKEYQPVQGRINILNPTGLR